MIPIAKPFLGKEEATAARDVILSGWVTQGPKVKEFEEAFASYVGAKHACAVSSCTTALHAALLTMGVSPGDIVVTVSHSFIATANVVRYCGAEPVFIDVDCKTLNMSADALRIFLERECSFKKGKLFYKKVQGLSTQQSPLFYGRKDLPHRGRIAALLVVHQIGIPCDLKALVSLARQYHLPVIEDAACAIGSEISFDQGKNWERIGKPHGDIACFSFHPRKVLTTGEGGMLTTNKAKHDKNFRLLRQHGMSVSDLKRHQSQKIIFEQYPDLGFNYRMTDIQAAIGFVQLKKMSDILKKRNVLVHQYKQGLRQVPWLKVMDTPAYAKSNWQSFGILLLAKAPLSRNQLMQHLLGKGISTRAGIMNIHKEKSYKGPQWHLPHSEKLRRNMILLPLFQEMKEEQVQYVIKELHHV